MGHRNLLFSKANKRKHIADRQNLCLMKDHKVLNHITKYLEGDGHHSMHWCNEFWKFSSALPKMSRSDECATQKDGNTWENPGNFGEKMGVLLAQRGLFY